MEAVTLSAGVRENLLSLQDTAQLMQTSQQRLATGKRVNSALDNPGNFFTSQSLSSRAADLNGLLDQIGQAQQTLETAANGIAAQMKLVQSAISVAERAKLTPQTATGYNNVIQIVGTTDLTPTPATVITSGVDVSQIQTTINGTVIRVGGTPYTVVSSGSPGLDQMIVDINSSPGLGPGGAATASKDSGGHLILTSNSAATITVDPFPGGALATGLINPDMVQLIPALEGKSLTVQANGSPPKTIIFGSGGVRTYGDLKQALAGTGADDYMNPFGGPPRLELNTIIAYPPDNPQPSLTLSGSALGPLGITAGARYGSLIGTADPTRAALSQQYNQIVQQVDQTAADSSYRGVNLLKGDTLNVAFNETGTSTLAIDGAADDATGLGLYATSSDGFQTNEDVDVHLNALVAALATLRMQASQFGSNLGVVQVRQDFTNQMVSALQSGADNLVLDDSNQEGASLLALQTRQQLSTTALSLSAQSDQAVLRLFQPSG